MLLTLSAGSDPLVQAMESVIETTTQIVKTVNEENDVSVDSFTHAQAQLFVLGGLLLTIVILCVVIFTVDMVLCTRCRARKASDREPIERAESGIQKVFADENPIFKI